MWETDQILCQRSLKILTSILTLLKRYRNVQFMNKTFVWVKYFQENKQSSLQNPYLFMNQFVTVNPNDSDSIKCKCIKKEGQIYSTEFSHTGLYNDRIFIFEDILFFNTCEQTFFCCHSILFIIKQSYKCSLALALNPIEVGGVARLVLYPHWTIICTFVCCMLCADCNKM